MKKKKIVSVLLIALTLFEVFAFAIPTIVNAASSGTLSHPKVPDVWYTRRGGGKPYMSAQYETYSMDGKVVYCIEPGIDINFIEEVPRKRREIAARRVSARGTFDVLLGISYVRQPGVA